VALFRRFGKKNQSLFGLDITSTAVKLLELKKTDKSYRVESYAVEPLPLTAVVEKTITDIDAVAQSIRRVVKRSGTRSKQAVVAVPASSSISKIVSVPEASNDQELLMSVQYMAEDFIPYPLEEVSLDFEVIGPTEGNPEQLDVLVAACRTTDVDLRREALLAAGITPAIVDVESYAMENAFSLIANHLPENLQTVAVVDIGATVTSLNIIHDRKIIYTREQAFGGRLLTEEIQRKYGLSYEEAGMAKRQGGLPESYVTELLHHFKETLIQQVSRSLQFYYANHQKKTVAHIVLAGGSASISGIDELIESSIGIPTTIANPFADMSLSRGIKAQVLSNDAPALMVACGLALRSFD
jgi:type IV pilus assembly protein PilM